MRIYTIGFTKKSAEQFFELLRHSGAKRLVDVRLHNRSQLAGFTKKDDLPYFLRRLCDMDYIHLPELAPTPQLLNAYQKKAITWSQYEREFRVLLNQRHIEQKLPKELIADSCLLCSEPTADRCHRRIVAEYLREKWGDIEIVHLPEKPKQR